MSDDFCVEHGYEFMRCEKVWGAIPYCVKCEWSNTRAGAEPATRQADHGRAAVGRTGDSISPTGAPSIEKLRRASMAVYLACEADVADDIAKLLRWAADEIERLSALTPVKVDLS